MPVCDAYQLFNYQNADDKILVCKFSTKKNGKSKLYHL